MTGTIDLGLQELPSTHNWSGVERTSKSTEIAHCKDCGINAKRIAHYGGWLMMDPTTVGHINMLIPIIDHCERIETPMGDKSFYLEWFDDSHGPFYETWARKLVSIYSSDSRDSAWKPLAYNQWRQDKRKINPSPGGEEY